MGVHGWCVNGKCMDGAWIMHGRCMEITQSHVGEGFWVASEVYERLYSYQREGVLFLYTLYKSNKGGILGDDMGWVGGVGRTWGG